MCFSLELAMPLSSLGTLRHSWGLQRVENYGAKFWGFSKGACIFTKAYLSGASNIKLTKPSSNCQMNLTNNAQMVVATSHGESVASACTFHLIDSFK